MRTDVQAWIDDAKSDLALAAVRKTKRIRYEHLCFHAQQAAEKAVKAVLVACGGSVPRTHDIAFLLDQLPTFVAQSPPITILPVLTKYAVQNRYPGQDLPVSAVDRKKALRLAGHAVAWAEAVIRNPPLP
jgi:HEPN domain-containing protein